MQALSWQDITRKAAFLVACVALAFSCVLLAQPQEAHAVARPSTAGQLQVSNGSLVSQAGKKVQLKGVSTHGLSWYPQYVNKSTFKHLSKNWKCNVVRLAMYTEEYNGFCSGDAANRKQLRALLDKGIKAAKAANMYVIVDWHILSDGNPNTHVKQAKRFFKYMAKKYKGYNNVIYEICNEPNGVTWGQVKRYANKVIKVIRTYDKKSVILVGTPTWSQDLDAVAANPITGRKNIMYSLHFYAATHTDSLRATYQRAVKAGLPVFVSEFGISSASGDGSISTAEGNKWIAALNKHKTSYVMWGFCNKAETSALIKSSCTKVSGFQSKNLTASGKWYTRILTGKAKLPAVVEDAAEPEAAGGFILKSGSGLRIV